MTPEAADRIVCIPFVRALLTVGSERTAIDSAMRVLMHADGRPLTRAEARVIVREVRA